MALSLVKLKPEDGLNPVQKYELIQITIKKILEGISASEILKSIEINTPLPVSKSEINHLYEDALRLLQANNERDAESIISLHIVWYEQIYNYFDSINNVPGKNKAMAQKERLIGMHKSKLQGKINRDIRITRPVFEYNLDLLTVEEKAEFQMLIDKASNGILSVTLNEAK